MDQLHARLQTLADIQLDLFPVLQYLKSLDGGGDTAEALEGFESVWGKDRYALRLKIAYIKGSWTPSSVASSLEISKQRKWEDYVQRHSSVVPTNNNKLGVGFALGDILAHKFWQHLYSVYGQKVTSFLLEKTLIISEVEPDFHLIFATNSSLCLKLAKPTNGVAFNKNHRNLLPPLNNNPHPMVNPYHAVGPKEQQQQAPPDVDVVDKVEELPVPPIMTPSSERKRRKRKREDDAEESTTAIETSITHLKKKVKLLDLATAERPNVAIASRSTKSSSHKNTNPPNTNAPGVIRWFKPTEVILKFLVDTREQLKRSKSLIATQSRPEDAMNQLYYVCIMEDVAFGRISGNNLSYIVKQFAALNIKKLSLPVGWEGLKIIQPNIANPSGKYNVNVYKISEKFARANNIRVHRKGRRGKRKGQIQVSTPTTAVEDVQTSTSVCNQSLSQVPPVVAPPTPTPEQLSRKESIDLMRQHEEFFNPYNPLMTLEIMTILYNRSSWARWSSNHPMKQASSKETLTEGCLYLLNNILDTDVGSSRHEFCADAFIEPVLQRILEKAIIFHKHVHDVHGVVKRTLSFWMMKKETKTQKKEALKLERKEWRSQNPRRLTKKLVDRSAALLLNASHETIDLTQDTPSTEATVSSLGLVNNSDEMKVPTSKRTSFNNQTLIWGKQGKTKMLFNKLKEKIPHTCVTKMLDHILHLTGMKMLLGSKANQRKFQEFLRKSLILAGTKSSLQVGQMMSSLDPSSCSWIESDIPPCMKSCLLAKAAKWIFTYLLYILRTSFYITDTSNSRFHACFYLREAWKSVSDSACHNHSLSGSLRKIGKLPEDRETPQHLWGINSKIRFLPKANLGLRPIISLRKESRDKMVEKKAQLITNYVIMRKFPHRVRHVTFIQTRWLNFLTEWKRQGHPKLYYVKADIHDAFPSVNLTRLQGILFSESQGLGTLTLKEFKVFTRSRAVLRKSVLSSEKSDLWHTSLFMRPCLALDCDKNGGGTVVKPMEDVFNNLFPFKNENVVKIGSCKYSFHGGLPQGWILSEAYCNLYYGNMDLDHFSRFLNNRGEYFHTTVDDYVYITPNPRRASDFYTRVKKGFPDYGCVINSKIRTNLYPNTGIPSPRQGCEWLNSCGWTYCLSCGHIMRDFGNYKGHDTAATVSFSMKNAESPESFLLSRMKVMLAGRLNGFTLDPRINCRGRIMLNIWEAACIFAFRFYAICRVIYPNLSVLKIPDRAKGSVAAILVCAKSLSRTVASHFNVLPNNNGPFQPHCTSKNHSCSCIESYNSNDDSLKKAQVVEMPMDTTTDEVPSSKTIVTHSEIMYITYHAFTMKLKRHHSVFSKEVLPRVGKLQKTQACQISSHSLCFIKTILPSVMPTHFQDIKI